VSVVAEHAEIISNLWCSVEEGRCLMPGRRRYASSMTVHVGSYEFDDVSYDREGDVLYLSRGETHDAGQTLATTEGHAVRLDGDGEVVGITLVNAKWLLERDGKLPVALPGLIEPDAEDLAQALAE
jgi:uncharacterized protein YuzE